MSFAEAILVAMQIILLLWSGTAVMALGKELWDEGEGLGRKVASVGAIVEGLGLAGTALLLLIFYLVL